MSNIPEEIGKGVSSVTGALQGNPLCITAVVLSAFFAVLTFALVRAERNASHERELALINRCIAALDDTPAVPQARGNNLRFGGPR